MVNKLKKKKCKECNGEFKPYNPLQFICSPLCALNYNRKQSQTKEAKDWKETRKKIIEKLKTLTDYENEAKKEFQKFIRIRDKNLPCISCNTLNCSEWAGGHYFEAGQYSGLIFDETNCHKQCNVNCNKFKHGNLIEYRIGLIKRYGEVYVKILEEKAINNRNKKYTREDLINIKNHYKNLNKIYEKQNN